MPKRLRLLIYANLAICAIILGLLCHFLSSIHAHSAESRVAFILAIGAYITMAVFSILTWQSIAKLFILPGQKARASLLASLPHYKTDNVTLETHTYNELATEIAEYIENLAQGQRAIVNYSSDLICSLNEQGKILNSNASAENIWLHRNTSLIGAVLADLAEAGDKPRLMSYLERLVESTGEAEMFECRMLDVNGRLIDFRWNIEWSPSTRRFYCIGSDITLEKEIERLRAEITSMVSHDLRAPVSSLAYFVDGLLSGDFGNLNETGRTQVVQLRSNLDQILRLIDQLLNAEQLEAGSLKVQVKIVPANAIVEAATSMLGPASKAKNIELLFTETDELVFADFDRCVQVMNNLISNAIKFSPDSSSIKIACTQNDGFLKFEVSDQGPGIAPEFWSTIFERFKSLENTSSKKGAGLGLYMSKKLIELQQGQIGIYSVPSKGSTFWFTLKLASEDDLPGYLE